jgi:UDP-glucose 4-epimerase
VRTLITGGAGFIGSHLAEALLEQGHRVTVLDDLSTGRMENIAHLEADERFSSTIGSATNDALVATLVQQADVVFHLAAAVGVRLVMDKPVHTIEANVHGTETVLKHASRHDKVVLIASTSEVYGKSAVIPFREEADLVIGPPSKTRWGYATSKLLDEFLAMAYWKERGTRVIIVRLFNTVGPRQSSRYGMVLPNFVKRALDGAPITVHGDGSQTRSFTWVGDVVAAIQLLVNAPEAIGEVFNIGNGAEISIGELAHKVRAMVGSASPIEYVPYDQVFDDSFEDMPRRVPDIAKIKAYVGYKPSVALDEIIQHVIAYWMTSARQNVAPTAAARSAASRPRLVPSAVSSVA